MFDPIDVPTLLPYLVLVDVVKGPEPRFQYKLLGTKVTEMAGSDFSGRFVEDGVSNSQHLVEMYQEIHRTGVLHFYKGASRFPHRKDYLAVERVSIPMSEDGHSVDKILTLMNYIYSSQSVPPILDQ